MIYWTLIWYCIKFFYDKNIQGRFKDVNIWSKTSINFQPIFNVAATVSEVLSKFSADFQCYCDVASKSIFTAILNQSLTSLFRRKFVHIFFAHFWRRCDVESWSRIYRIFQPMFDITATSQSRQKLVESFDQPTLILGRNLI